MVKVEENKTILDHQLDNFMKIVDIEDIIVVVGFKKDIIINKYPNLSVLYNKDYIKTNTSKSLLLAFEKIGVNTDVLWINGDIVFDPEILKSIIKNNNKNLICVNNSYVSEEEVKYTINNQGHIKEISKKVGSALGEAVGINFIKKESIEQVVLCLKDCESMDYFEKGIECAIKNGVNFFPLNINDYFCVEIDFQKDLKKAVKYMKGYK